MSSQCYIPPKTAEDKAKEKKEAADLSWQWGNYLRSVMGGNPTGRMINWSALPRLSIWR